MSTLKAIVAKIRAAERIDPRKARSTTKITNALKRARVRRSVSCSRISLLSSLSRMRRVPYGFSALELGQALLHRVGDPHRVRADLLAHRERHRRTPVDAVVALRLLVAVVHRGDVADPHERAPHGHEDRVPHVLGVLGAVDDRDRALAAVATHGAHLPHQVERRDLRANGGGIEAEGRDLVLVQLDLQAALPPSRRRARRRPRPPGRPRARRRRPRAGAAPPACTAR